jgi:hypothetical protein
VTRRLFWLGLGAAAGSGATVWVRRRVEQLARRITPQSVAGGVVTKVDQGARATAGHVRDSLDTGRAAARRRELELRHDLGVRDLTR